MKRRSLTLSFLLLSTSLVQAESSAEKAFKASLDDINKSGVITAEYGSMHYQEDKDLLTVQNLVFKLDWNFPISKAKKEGQEATASEENSLAIKVTFDTPIFTATGVKQEDNGTAYDSIAYEGQTFRIELDAPDSDADRIVEVKSLGKDTITNSFGPYMGEFKVAPMRPIGSVMDYIRPLIFKMRYEKAEGPGYIITQSLADGTIVETTEAGPYKLSDLANGKIGSYEIAYQKGSTNLKETLSKEISGQENGKVKADILPDLVSYEIGKTTYTGYDIGAFWSLFDPKAPPLNGTTTLLKQVDYGALKVNSPGLLSLTAGPSVQKDLTISTPATEIVPILDRLIANDQEFDDLSQEDQEKLIKNMTDAIRGFSMGLTEAGDMKTTITIPEGPFTGQTANISLGKMRIANVNSNGIEEASLSDLTYAGPPSINFALGRAAIEKLEFPDYAQLEKVIRNSIAGNEPSASDGAKLAPNALTLLLSDLSYTDKENSISAKGIRSEVNRKGLAVPAYLSTKIENLQISKSLIKQPLITVLLDQLGMDSLTVNEDITLDWDKTKETLQLDPMKVELPGIAALSGIIGVNGIKQAYLEYPEQAQAAMATAAILPSSLTLTDLGGMNEVINLAGGMSGMGPDQVRSFAEGQVQAMLSTFTKPDFARMVADQVKAFLADPQSLKIALTPGAPVPVAQVIGAASTAPQSIPDILNIGVTANGK